MPRGDRPGARAGTEVPGCTPLAALAPGWSPALQCCRMGSSQAREKAWQRAGHRQEAAGRLWHWQWQAHRQGWAPLRQIDRCLLENILLIVENKTQTGRNDSCSCSFSIISADSSRSACSSAIDASPGTSGVRMPQSGRIKELLLEPRGAFGSLSGTKRTLVWCQHRPVRCSHTLSSQPNKAGRAHPSLPGPLPPS